MLHLRAAKHAHGRAEPRLDRRVLEGRQHSKDTWRRFCSCSFNTRHTAPADRGAYDPSIGRVPNHVMPLIRVGRGAGDLQRTVDTNDRLANDLELIDRVPMGRGCELHGVTPSLLRSPTRAYAPREGS